jgi:hypothetical protein
MTERLKEIAQSPVLGTVAGTFALAGFAAYAFLPLL